MNMESASTSPNLFVSRITVGVGAVPAWIIRHQDAGDLQATAAAPVVAYPNPVRFGRSWRIFSRDPAQGAAAAIELRFEMTF
jgi:hypothetical protein